MAKAQSQTKSKTPETLKNRRALRDFHVIETFEAGIVLKGSEVKSLRAGKANFVDSYARVEKDEVWLYGFDIQPYEHASHEKHDPRAKRKLLLHRREINELHRHVTQKGNTLVALKVYWKNGKAKIALAAAKGKAAPDKRQDLKAKAEKRESDRAMAAYNRRG